MPRRLHVAISALSLALAANACGGATSASGRDAGSATDAETAPDAAALDAADTPDTAPVVPACTQAQRDARYRSTITKPIIPHKSFEGIDPSENGSGFGEG